MSAGIRSYLKEGRNAHIQRYHRVEIHEAGGHPDYPLASVTANDSELSFQTGSDANGHYIRFAYGQTPGVFRFTNNTSSNWNAASCRFLVSETTNIESNYILIASIPISVPAIVVPVNYSLDITEIILHFGENRGAVEHLIDGPGYGANRDWQYVVRNASGTAQSGGTITVTNATPFTDHGTASFRDAGPRDVVNTSGSNWSAAQVQINCRPPGSGTYRQVGIATFGAQQVLVNQTLRMTNITLDVE